VTGIRDLFGGSCSVRVGGCEATCAVIDVAVCGVHEINRRAGG
jgi:hypothetical protein